MRSRPPAASSFGPRAILNGSFGVRTAGVYVAKIVAVVMLLSAAAGCHMFFLPDPDSQSPAEDPADQGAEDDGPRNDGSPPDGALSDVEFLQALQSMGYPIDEGDRVEILLGGGDGGPTDGSGSGVTPASLGRSNAAGGGDDGRNLRFVVHRRNFAPQGNGKMHLSDTVFVEFPGHDHVLPLVLRNANITIDPSDPDTYAEGTATPPLPNPEESLFGAMEWSRDLVTAVFVRTREELQSDGYDDDVILGSDEDPDLSQDDLFLLFDVNSAVSALNQYSFGVEMPQVSGVPSYFFLVVGIVEDWPLFLLGD